MWWLLSRIGAFVLRRLATFLVLALFLVLVTALYLAGQHYFRDAERRADEVRELIQLREERLASIRGEMERVAAETAGSLAVLEQRVDGYRRELEVRRRQLEELGRNVDRLRDWWLWTRSWVSAEAARELAQRESRRQALEEDLLRAEQGLLQNEARAEEFRVRLGKRSGELAAQEEELRTELEEYRAEERELRSIAEQRRRLLDTTLFWLQAGFRKAGPWLVLLALSLFLFPPLLKVGLYYSWAPLLQRARPVRLAVPSEKEPPSLTVGESRPSLELIIPPEESVVLHHDYYQASDEDLTKKTRFLLDRRFPFTSLACRLAMLTEVRNTGRTPARITVSDQEDAVCELSLVEVPSGSSVVLRPSHLVAVRHPSSGRPVIRSHWCFGRLHAWITLQFRYFEFLGPCSLVVKGRRGVRGETVSADPDSPGRMRRTNQTATIGFSPTLDYNSRRAETFWSYFTGKNPLFDDAFAGRGVFVCQQIGRDEARLQATSFWKGVGDAFLKAFGL